MTLTRRFATAVVDHRRWVIGSWVILAAVLMPLASRVEQRLEVAATIKGSESARVEQLLAERFTSGIAQYAVLVMTGAPDPRTPGGVEFLKGVRGELKAQPFVSGTFSYLDAPDNLFVGKAGTTFMVVGLKPGAERPDKLIPRLRAITAGNGGTAKLPKVQFTWTGEIALNHDLRLASATDAQNVVTMLGLGLGIDYALLVVGRFREGLVAGLSPREAAIDAGDQAGHTILLSGASVCIGFAALIGIPVNELKSLAVGGLLVIVMAVMLAITLLPALLAMLGHKVNWLSIGRRNTGNGSDRWRAWGRFVCAHPAMVLIVAGVPIAALALQARRLNTDLPRGDWLPPKMESAVGLRTLRDSQRSGIVNAIRIVVELPKESPWDSPAGWDALKRAGDAFARDRRVARVRSLPAVTGLVSPNLQVVMAIPQAIRGS